MIETAERAGRPGARWPSTSARDSMSRLSTLLVNSFHASISPIVTWASAAEESSLPRNPRGSGAHDQPGPARGAVDGDPDGGPDGGIDIRIRPRQAVHERRDNGGEPVGVCRQRPACGHADLLPVMPSLGVFAGDVKPHGRQRCSCPADYGPGEERIERAQVPVGLLAGRATG